MIQNTNVTNAALVGAGRMGRRHLQAILKLGLNISAVVDINQISLDEVKKEYNLSADYLFQNLDDLFSKRIPDCLVIATTADSHCHLTCKAAEHGVKYILVEKPMAVSLDECELMIQVCKKNGTMLSVNHQMRFMEQYSIPKDLLKSEEYGGIKSMTVIAGNFGLAMNGTHYLEAFRYMTDESPYEVTAWFDEEKIANPRGNQFEDQAGSIRITSVGGKRLYLEIGSDQGHGCEVVYAARNGIISISELTGHMKATVRKSEFRDLPTTRYGMPAEIIDVTIASAEVIDSSALVLKALIDDENRVTAQDGLLTIKALVAAYTSAEKGSLPIKINESLDCKRKFPWA